MSRPPSQRGEAPPRASRFSQSGARATRLYVPGRSARDAALAPAAQPPLKLSSNENLLGAAPGAVEAIRAALGEVHLYPDARSRDLRQRLAEQLGLSAAHITTGNGADGVLYNLGMAVIDQGDEVILPQITFPIYETIVAVMRGVVVRSTLRGLRIDLDDLLARIGPRTRLIFLCNPNNPTGDALPPDALAAFLARVPRDVLVVLDEAYIDFADEAQRLDTPALLRQGMDNLFLVRSFSKIYGLAGVRFGYGVGDPALVALIDRVRPPFEVSLLAERAALGALADPDFARRSRQGCARERQRCAAGLEALGLAWVPSQTNFLLIDLGRDAGPVAEALQDAGLLVRPGGNFGLPTCLRATLGLPEATDRLLNALAAVLARPPEVN